jgi:FO synthase
MLPITTHSPTCPTNYSIQSGQADVSALSPTLQPLISAALDGTLPSDTDAPAFTLSTPEDLPTLCRTAAILRDRGHGNTITFSPKVFIPLTRLCRDFCGYCTFRQSPSQAERLYMTPDQAVEVAAAGQRLGCAEALFTLGERPEQRYPQAKQWLADQGFRTTLDYLGHVSTHVLDKTTLLPHANPGTMSRREMSGLKPLNASMGVMMEVLSPRLTLPGMPHHRAPSKYPAVRLKTLDIAGHLKVPFTTGILIGIGETRQERIDTLLAIRRSHQQYGHVQEVIVQNFRAKPATDMSQHPDASTLDLLWTVAVARLILGPHMSIQVPPNLSANDYPIYLLAGINDWGGVSPLTIDYVNPEAPWPGLADLHRHTAALGFQLKPRLPVYPRYILDESDFLPQPIRERALSLAGSDGYVKGGIQRYVRSDTSTQ